MGVGEGADAAIYEAARRRTKRRVQLRCLASLVGLSVLGGAAAAAAGADARGDGPW